MAFGASMETTVKVDEHILIGGKSPQFIGLLFKTRLRPKFGTEKSV